MKPTTAIDDGEVQAILERVRARVAPPAVPQPAAPQPAAPQPTKSESAAKSPAASPSGEGAGVFATVDAAVTAADRAQRRYADLGLDARRQVIDAVRAAMRVAAAELGRLAHQETGLGRPEDKRLKNLLVTEVVTGDGGMTVTEYAPWGVIGSITPTTNPTATIINNTIAALAAGNAVVFNPHPAARRVSAENVRLLNRAILAGGGPPNLVATIPEPTIETARELMHHRGVRLLLVTGGGAVV